MKKEAEEGVDERLLPCPFCGGRAGVIEKESESESYDPDIYYDVACHTEGCYLSYGADWYYKTSEDARRAWNTRGGVEFKVGFCFFPADDSKGGQDKNKT